MNDYRIQTNLRDRLEGMTDARLAEVGADIKQLCQDAIKIIEAQAGKPFWEVTAELIAKDARHSPKEMASLKETVSRCPILAHHMLPHFPELDWLQEAASREPAPSRKRSQYDYVEAAMAKRDAAWDRWEALKAKVDSGNASHVERLDELVAYAELHAGAHTVGAAGMNKAVQAHIREQLINGIVKFLMRLADPKIGAAEPTKMD